MAKKVSKFYQSSLIVLLLMCCKSKTADTSWQDCQARGGTWRFNECLFKVSKQESCLNQANGSQWVNNICISEEEIRCIENGHLWDRFQCLPPTLTSCSEKGDDWLYENKICRKKEFIDYCLHNPNHTLLNTLKSVLKIEDCTLLFTHFQKIKSLNLSHNNFEDLRLLKDASQLLSLTLDHSQLPEQKILAPKLEVVIARNIKLKNLDKFQNLSFLKYLDLSDNQITDISQLHFFKHLETFIGTNNQITEINSKNLPPSLKVLDINQNSIQNFTITELDHLEEINVTDNHISILSINQAPSLKKLFIGGQKKTAQITDLHWIKELHTLEFLALPDHAVQDITPLRSLPLLKTLDLERNQIDNIMPLESLENLREISLNGNPIDFTHRRTSQTCPKEALSRIVAEYCTTAE